MIPSKTAQKSTLFDSCAFPLSVSVVCPVCDFPIDLSKEFIADALAFYQHLEKLVSESKDVLL